MDSNSSSDSSQKQTTDTQDNRIAAATNSVNLVASRSSIGNINIQPTDYGAIDSAFKFSNASSDSAFKFANATNDSAMKTVNAATDSAFKFGDSTVSQSFDFANSIATGAANELAASGAQSTALAKTAMQSVQDAYASSQSSVANAYKNTSDTLAAAYVTSKAGEQKVMVAVGVIVVGIVALKALGKA